MQAQDTHAHRRPSRAREAATRALLLLALGVLLCVALPALSIALGVFLLVAVGVHVWAPELRAPAELFLRAVVVRAAPDRRRLLGAAACAGGLLILGGSVSATLRGELRSEREHRERERALEEERLRELLERAEEQLGARQVDAAELTLLELVELVPPTVEGYGEAEQLRERVRRSGDPATLRAILDGLPPDERRALEEGRAVPRTLDFGHPALNARALRLALVLIEEARAPRPRSR